MKDTTSSTHSEEPKMKCQKCNRLFVEKGMRYCVNCKSMSLAEKIIAQREYKERMAKRMEQIKNQFNQEVA